MIVLHTISATRCRMLEYFLICIALCNQAESEKNNVRGVTDKEKEAVLEAIS